ncbi:unnamed protein product [Amoebophrya sp. A120]|nr:unnamed protein product [Amoebophrya sp. A120]|eukprot:GSA120T00015315001.1
MEGRSKYVSACAAGPDAVSRWSFPPYQHATQKAGDVYKVCLFAGGGLPIIYEIRLHVEKKLDLHLSSLKVSGHILSPKFSPLVREYTVMIDKNSSGVKFSAGASSRKMRIRFKDQRGHEKTHPAGTGEFHAILPPNDEKEPPIWQEAVEISVLPPEGAVASKQLRREYNYIVTIKRRVSDYAALTMLTTADTPCTMDPPFDPDVTDYKCVWWWEYSKYAYFEADIDFEGPCHGCTINVPNPKANWHGATQLNWPARRVHKVPWGRKTIWTKYFLYGEFHTVPILVTSEDQVTGKEYRIMFYRQCPWWMKASITRAVSKTATTVAVVMSVASAGNLMALAKQIQFMDLTADIRGCPKVYADFTKSISGFNFDIKQFMPDWLTMGPAKFHAYKEQILGQIKVTTIYCKKLHSESHEAARKYLKVYGPEFFEEFIAQAASSIGVGPLETTYDAGAPLFGAAKSSRRLAQAGTTAQLRPLSPSPLVYAVNNSAAEPGPHAADIPRGDVAAQAAPVYVLQHEDNGQAEKKKTGTEEVADKDSTIASARLVVSRTNTNAAGLLLKTTGQQQKRASNVFRSGAERVTESDPLALEEEYRHLRSVSVHPDRSARTNAQGLLLGSRSFAFSIWTSIQGAATLQGQKSRKQGADTRKRRGFHIGQRVNASGNGNSYDFGAGNIFSRDISWPGEDSASTVENETAHPTYHSELELASTKSRRLQIFEETTFDKHGLPILSCEGNAAAAREKALDTLRELEDLQKMLNGVAGNLIVICILMITGFAFYWTYFFLVYRKQQTRLMTLEAGPLWIFLLDYGLINFSKAASNLMFSDKDIVFFGFHPSPYLVKFACLLGLIGYPVGFLCFVVYMMVWLQRPGQEKLIWNKKLQKYVDVECREMKIEVPSIVPGFVPIFSQLLKGHSRGAIPIRDDEGKVMYFGNRKNLTADELKELEAKASQGGHSTLDYRFGEKVHRILCDLMKKDEAEFRRMRDEEGRKDQMKKDKEEGMKKLKKEYRAQVKKVEEEMAQEAARPGAALGPDWLVELFKEEPENWNWMETLKPSDKRRLMESKEVCQSLDDMRDDWLSKKKRGDDERLEDEEKFALLQWFDASMRKQRLLEKYNILSIVPRQGHLKPHTPDDDDFRRGVHYIENDLSQRLIYPGDQPGNKYIPGGQEAATLFWSNEPAEGWNDWELNPKKGKHVQYATKWQYICFDYPSKPWFEDEEGDSDIYSQIIPFYSQIQAYWRKRYSGRVQRNISEHEKKEIKKWIFVELQPYYERKMKLAYYADQHPEFLRPRSLADLVSADYQETLLDIRNPRRWYKVEDRAHQEALARMERAKHDRRVRQELATVEKELADAKGLDEPKKAALRRKKAQLQKQVRDLAFQDVGKKQDDQEVLLTDEEMTSAERDLLDYALMKFEDTYPEGAEPWWSGCDEPQKKETKIMFDERAFWQEIRKERVKENPHLPQKGYCTSPVFTKYPDVFVGYKRYNIEKPDGARTNVEVQVQMQHVYPIMKYVPRFKVNVPEESLEFPTRQSWNIVVGKISEGQEFDYVVDRFSTLVSIGVLAARPPGAIQASVFFGMKLFVLVNQARSDYKTVPPRREVQEDPATGEKFERNVARDVTDALVISKFVGGDVFVWFMQSVTLAFLTFGMTQIIPPPLTALFCVLVTSGTMITMNARSFKDEFRKMVLEAEEKINDLKAKIEGYRYYIREVLASIVIPFSGGQYLFPKLRAATAGSAVLSAMSIDIMVQEMGVIFVGEPEIDPKLPPEEQRMAGMKKSLQYYASPARHKARVTSVRATDRYEDDVKSGMTVGFSIDQLCLRKKVPTICATIQVVNHYGTEFCEPRYDSYLTLYKPSNWEEEDDEDPVKLEDLLSTWHEQVYSFLTRDLGGLITERTGTYEIVQQVDQMLAKEFAEGASTKTIVVRMCGVEHVKTDIMEAGNQDFYGMVLHEAEDPTLSFPEDRMTTVVEGEYEDELKLYEGATWNQEIAFDLAPGETSITFSVWDADPGGMDDFIGYTNPIGVEKVKSSWSPILTTALCQRRVRHDGKVENVPITGAFNNHKFDEKEYTEDEKLTSGFKYQIRSYNQKEQQKKAKRVKFVKNMVKKGPTAYGYSALVALAPKVLNEIAKVVGETERQILDIDPHELMSSDEEDEEDLAKRPLTKEQEAKQKKANILTMPEVEALSDEQEQIEEKARTLKFYKACARETEMAAKKASIKEKERKGPTQRKVGDKIVDVEQYKKEEEMKKKEGAGDLNRSSDKLAAREEALRQFEERSARDGSTVKKKKFGRIEDHGAFCAALEDKLELYEKKAVHESKKVVHYVAMSDQIKPNKIWKPDAIPNHVAEVIIKEYTEIEGVEILEPTEGLTYHEMVGKYMKGGRLNEKLYFTHDEDDLFLYWDGRDRWILSPELGASIHEAKYIGGPWAFSTDAVATPDMIDEPFSVAEPGSDGFGWVIDPGLRVVDHAQAEAQRTAGKVRKMVLSSKMAVQRRTFESPYLQKAQELYLKAVNIVFPDQGKMSRTFRKDVLVSLASNFVQLRWKDQNIEDLAPFRKFLLAAFESYNAVWTFLTRDLRFETAAVREGLKTMLSENQIFPDEDPEELCKTLMEQWCAEKKLSDFGVKDVHNLLDHPPHSPKLAKLRDWALDHEDFNEVHELWSALTRSCEMDADQFIAGVKILVTDYEPKLVGHEDEIHSFCLKLFKQMDAQESGGISRAEMAPASGEAFADNDQSVLQYRVPLSYFMTVTLNRTLSKVSLRVASRFVDKKEWRQLRLALDPDWKCADIYEERLEIMCRLEYFELWEAVVQDSEMEKKQSFIRHYEGQVADHQFVGGIYMRHGQGEQKWPDGRVYVGGFQQHMPHGHGNLWAGEGDIEDEEKHPLYAGDWADGKRCGYGKLYWEQSTQDPTRRRGVMTLLSSQQRKGISKVYEGNFRDDLFHGQGKLYVENSVIAKVPNVIDAQRRQAAKADSYIPLPQIDPAQMLSFEGEFRSDWGETRKYLMQNFAIEWPESKNYEIDRIPDMEDESGKKHFKFWRFLPVDNRNLQLAGAAPYEFGLDVYQMKAGESLHMYEGKAIYADDSAYEGTFQFGKPHGTGRLVQRAEQDGGEFRDIYHYDGEWADGQRNGEGESVDHTSNIVYRGQWKQDKKNGFGKQVVPPDKYDAFGYKWYEGEWEEDKRHGYGQIMLPTDIVYRGPFRDNLREGRGVLCAEDMEKTRREVVVEYDNFGEAIGDVELLGGELGDVFVSAVCIPGKGFHGAEAEAEGTADKKKAKRKKKGDEEGGADVSAAAAETANKACKAHHAGISLGWQLVQIDDDRRKFLDYAGEDLLKRYSEDREQPGVDPTTRKCRLVFTEFLKFMYKGTFREDKFYTTEDEKCWLLCDDESLYYGEVLEDGLREGEGVLFRPKLQERNPTLFRAWMGGLPYKSSLPEDKKHEEISYVGNWHKDQQSGQGISYHETGVYNGAFKEGKRHGRGRWQTHDGRWKYFAGSDPTHTNFYEDEMHGIATVEDDRYIHENVIFMHDKCIMPFTVKGPPISGFDNHPVFGAIMQARAGMRAAAKEARPDETAKGEQDKMGQTGQYKLDKNEKEHAFGAPDESAVIREDTDLTLPEDDLWLVGASGENELMNGVYWRLSETFGVPIFKHYRCRTGLLGTVHCERYLFMNEAKNKWLIAESPAIASLPKPPAAMTAQVVDSAEDPRDIAGTWQVYDPQTRSYKAFQKLSKEDEKRGALPVDRLRIVEMSGVEVSPCQSPMVLDGCFLRQPQELFGRPVFEMENGGQYLYWVSEDGRPLTDQQTEAGLAMQGHLLHKDRGFWCISDSLGAPPKDAQETHNWAHVESSAATPDEITQEWHTWQDSREYRKDAFLKIVAMKDFMREGLDDAPPVNEEMALALLQSRENTAASGY